VALRIKSRWTERAKLRPTEQMQKENAQALAFIFWRIALEKAKNLHGEDFIYDTDEQRVKVIGEYLAMLLQVADRMVHGRMDEDDRREFVTFLALRLADHMQDNAADLFGPADYRQPFIAMLNVRAEGYAGCRFSPEEGASYGFLHYFGSNVQRVMGEGHHSNKWVIDQAMDIDGPDAVDKAVKAVEDLFS